MGDGAESRVRREGTAGVTVKLKWPSTTPLQVRSAEGMLRLPDFDPRHPTQKQLSLTLIEALSNSVIGTAEADSGGRFSFPTPQPGLYFVRLNSSEVKSWSGDEISGDITIYVTPDAKSNGLSLDLGWSTCGLYYSDLSQCPQPELTVAQVCGDVFDPSGAVISKAQILLLKGEENPVAVAETSSDAKGHFFLPSPAVGTYELYAKGPSGFRGAHSTIHLSATNPAEYCVKPIPIQLGVFGSCSSIGLEEKQ